MRFKRDEPFRFTISPPIQGTFVLLKPHEKEAQTKKGLLSIQDISPSGLRVTSPLNLPVGKLTIHTAVQFTVNEKEIELDGIFIWKKELHNEYAYGIECFNSEEKQKEVIDEIKQYIRRTSGR
ncbi:PilZ domain-containing protein [Metabacillus iocasae]|uniref:PilZ domain-containing protein n=1 Tax=Priestia iocasae TaxID=2291674 RepID=A0ABS2QTI2_9BACI|nr:PilZ domain-containing protein [Metabacillus iocasae]MBM7702252.1 hypothetical protein [Metabacillus iocasae]